MPDRSPVFPAVDPALRRAALAIIDLALAEDIGAGDVTARATIPAEARGTAVLVAKAPGVLAGLWVAALVFSAVDEYLTVSPLHADGDAVPAGAALARVAGPTRSLLAAERTALNFLQRMSGIATATAELVAAVAGTAATVVDTRKTAPGQRMLDKYAVRVGGGANHRMNLSDGVLIKDNHLAAVGGVAQAVAAARAAAPHTLRVEVEVTSVAMCSEAVAAGADIIMLDNMGLDEMRTCVALVAGRALVEASGNMTAERIRAVAECGVDLISVGALTHSVRALDISLEYGQ